MLLVNFTAWKSRYIFSALTVLAIVFAFFMPQTQQSKNLFLFDAVVENNTTKARQFIKLGAELNMLIPTGYPLISLAIEYENEEMVKLLMIDKQSISRIYVENYSIVEHAASKKNKKILELIVHALERKKHDL